MTTRRHATRLLMFGLCFGVLTLGMGRPADAQTFSVTNLGDNGTGSLRQAIADANAAGGGTIEFDLTDCHCTIELTSGELVIEKNLTIKGPGPTLLTVSGEGASRVFRIVPGAIAELQGLAVRNGNGVGGGPFTHGGGIYNEGTLTLLDMIVAGNTPPFGGGGVYSSEQGALTVRNSVFSDNHGAFGGAIRSEGSLLIVGSTLEGNTADWGGGVFAQSGTIVGSTITGNTVKVVGGGFDVVGDLTLVNCTISGNSARSGGGGFAQDGTLTLINTTITANNATFRGGGLTSVNATFALNNSIVAGNSIEDVYADGPVINNNSLIGGNTDDVLLPLADNGGPTRTHALAPNSPAIGAGDNALLPADTLDFDGDGDTSEPIPSDQRGFGFPRVLNGIVDIGAVEAGCVPLTIASLPNATVGATYNHQLSAAGGEGPYEFVAVGLPAGMALSSEGLLTGTPATAGTFTFRVIVTEERGCADTVEVTLTVVEDTTCGIVIGPATLKTPYLATVYYQPLSVTPSGQYTVTVSAGALPQGVYLFAIGRSWFLGGIPTKPGEYTFTLAATKTNSPCAPTRTYTVIVPATVLPQLTCVAKTGAKQYTAHFGYDNSTEAAVAIPVGANNYFTPGAQDRGQVTTFQKGRVTNAFSVVFTVKNNNTDLALWYLRGPDNVRRPVNITTATSRCP